jgi:hypothetical protein
MEYDRLIRNWHGKASEEDYFSKFVFEYLSFIAFLRKKKFTDCRTDRDAIQHLKRDERIKTNYLERIRNRNNRQLKKAWEKIIKELNQFRLANASGNSGEVEEIRWWNCSHLQVQNQTEEERSKVKGVIHSLDDWENMVEFWSAIRNNLFHGAKDPQEERDKLAVENGYKALRELVEILLADEQNII